MKTTTIKVQMVGALLLASLAGCGSPDTGGGGGGAGGSATSSGGSTSSSAGGAGGAGGSVTTTTSTTGTGGSACNVPGPIECGPAITGYPDPFASYDPSALDVGPIGPLPAESPDGAAAGILGPYPDDETIVSVELIAGTLPGFCSLPDPVRIAVWTEPHCGLPADAPGVHAFDTPLATIAQQPGPGDGVQFLVPLPAPLVVPAGASAYVALMLSTPETCIESFESGSDFAPRAAWFGWADNNCDGSKDPALGWAYLDSPTAPGVGAYPNNPAFRVNVTP